MLSYPGSTPISVVHTPINSNEATRVDLRPIRSPKWPKRAEPKGRARKAMPNVRNADSIWAVPDVCGKNTGPITSAAAVA
ncbi:hypothetical protein D3C72_858950 [compost metagenome]